MKKIWMHLKQHWEIFSSIASIIIIIGFVVTVIAIIFKMPPITIEVKKQKYDYPTKFYDELETFSRYLVKVGAYRYSLDYLNESIDSLRVTLGSAMSFILLTQEFWTFEIANTTNHTIDDIDIRIPSVKQLYDLSIKGNLLTKEEEDSLYKQVAYDTTTGLLLIHGIKSLPPKAIIAIKLWGEKARPMGEPDIFVYSSNGVGRIIEPIKVEGFRAFIANNLEHLLFLFTLIILVIVTTKRSKTRKPK